MALDQVDVDKMDSKEDEMSFLEHLEQLRWHLFRAFASIFVFAIIVFVAKDFVFGNIVFGPKESWFPSYGAMCQLSNWLGLNEAMCFTPPHFEFITPGFGEKFIVHLKVSIMLGIIISFPYIFYEIWKFIKPGLYPNEAKAARGIVLICSLLFLAGVLFGYYVISPFAIAFLMGYDLPGVVSAPALSSYVDYMTMFTLPTGIIFELPIVVYFLSKIGMITPEFLKSYRKHAFVIILILSAIITPPDVITQFLIGVPVYVLYEISIVISKRVVAKREAAEKE